MSATFILVPRSNFEGRIAPNWLQDYLVSEDELRQTFKVPNDLDLKQILPLRQQHAGGKVGPEESPHQFR